jgi:tRNA threonylcarbamoyladenosine biosynthesis protein TsaE
MRSGSSRRASGIFKVKVTSRSVFGTIQLGKAIARHLEKGDILCLFGQLGSGKTVLTKGIAEGLGIAAKEITSPTFVLIRQYPKAKIPLYHFDLYRVHRMQDIAALGYEEYFYGEGVTVVEWADRLRQLLPEEYLKVELSVKGESRRMIEIVAIGARYKKLLGRIHEDTRY